MTTAPAQLPQFSCNIQIGSTAITCAPISIRTIMPGRRRVYLLLLTQFKPNGSKNRAVLLGALRDDAASVRWQAVPAVREASWDAAHKILSVIGSIERHQRNCRRRCRSRALGKSRNGKRRAHPLQQFATTPAVSPAAPWTTNLWNSARPSRITSSDTSTARRIYSIPTVCLGALDVPKAAFPRQFPPRTTIHGSLRVSSRRLGDLRYQPAEEILIALLTGAERRRRSQRAETNRA